MLYPRLTETGRLITGEQMVGATEHLLNQHRVMFITTEIGRDGGGGMFGGRSGVTAAELGNLLFALDSMNHQPIKIILDSPGGSLMETFLIIDLFRTIKSPIHTFGLQVASAAVLLLAAGEKRYLSEHARVMLHLPFAHLAGNTTELEVQHKEVDIAKNSMLDLFCSLGIKRTREQLVLDIERKEFWLSAVEAVDYGLADQIISPKILTKWLRK